MSAISRLNADALRHVFLQAPLADLLNATRVDISWHHLAQELIDNEIELELSERRQEVNLRLLSRLKSDQYLRHRIHHICVVDWLVEHPLKPREVDRHGSSWNMPWKNPWQKGGYLSKPSWRSQQRDDFKKDPSWPQLVALSRALAGLTLGSFTWAAVSSIPTVVVNALSLLSNCKVNVKRHDQALSFVFWTYTPILSFGGLNKITVLKDNLTQLELILPHGTPSLCEKLGVFISKCTMLKDLSLYTLGRLTPDRTTFETTNDMTWLSRPLMNIGHVLKLDRLYLGNFCLCRTSDFNIGQIVDTSCLRKTSLSCFSVLRGVEDGLPLTSFALHVNGSIPNHEQFCLNGWSIAAVQKFLMRCHRIEKLEIIDCDEILNYELIHHLGRTLQDLRVYPTHQPPAEERHRAMYFASWPGHKHIRPGSSLEITFEPHMVINSLATHCPNLRYLTILAPQEIEEFKEFLVLIGNSLSQLTSCTLVRAEERIILPPLVRFFAIENMSTLWTQVGAHMSKLSHLKVVMLPGSRRGHYTGASVGIHTYTGSHRRFLVTKNSSVVHSETEKRLRIARIQTEQRNKFVNQLWPNQNVLGGHVKLQTPDFLAIEDSETEVQRLHCCRPALTATIEDHP